MYESASQDDPPLREAKESHALSVVSYLLPTYVSLFHSMIHLMLFSSCSPLLSSSMAVIDGNK